MIVTPVRDEEEYISETIRSVAAQSILPVEWIIVNDGSKDNTQQIIDSYTSQYPWIKSQSRGDRGERLPGTGVMQAFYEGYNSLGTADWDFIVKLDGDVGLPADYFEQCFDRFNQDDRLGMCGGVMFKIEGGVRTREMHPLLHVRGPIKLYRRGCWDAIGGLITSPGWDTVDELQANYHGWSTRSFEDLEVMHYRPTGAAQGTWRDAVKNGKADYVSGYHPLFMAAKCISRLFRRPYAVVGLGQAVGYATGCARRMPRVADEGLIQYVRTQQMRRLFGMSSIWH